MKKQIKRSILALAISSLATAALAGTWVTRDIDRLLVDSTKANDPTYGEITRYGGCAVKFKTALNGEAGLAGCNATWVSLDCAAVIPGNSKAVALNAWATAQMAYVTGKSLRIEVDGTKKLNGFCYSPANAICDTAC